MMKASGWGGGKRCGPKRVADTCNSVINEGRIPKDWSKSWLARVYKGKRDVLYCGSCSDIKMLAHVIIIFIKRKVIIEALNPKTARPRYMNEIRSGLTVPHSVTR